MGAISLAEERRRCGHHATSPNYEPRTSDSTLLYRVVSEHLGDLLEHAAEHYERPLPPYVVAEIEGYLKCGQFEHGFVRCRCDACGLDLFVPFSCGSRSICPSCAARRMCNTAAHLVDRVLPNVPVRQWVLSLPFELRALALARPEVVSALGRIFAETVSRELRQSMGLPHAQCGAVSFLHRAGDSFNANPHWHAQQLDGVFFRDGPSGERGPIRFLPAPPPEPEQLERIAAKVRQRSVRWLARRGYIDERAYEERSNERMEPTAIEACAEVSLRGGSFATIDDQGALASGSTTTPIEPRRPGRFTVELGGFNINAAVRVAADDDVGRERLARYCARPSFALGRLSELDDGRLAYQLRYPRRGQTHRVMTPLELMARLAALVPPPRHPLVRYFGVLSSHSRWRRHVVPQPPARIPSAATSRPKARNQGRDRAGETTEQSRRHDHERDTPAPAGCHPAPPASSAASGAAPTEAATTGEPPTRLTTAAMSALLRANTRAGLAVEVVDGFNVITARHLERLLGGELLADGPRLDWARLMRRTLAIDPLRCPRCAGRLRPIAEITEPDVIARILEHLASQTPRAPPRERMSAADPPPPSLH